jgi:hypothetical protein
MQLLQKTGPPFAPVPLLHMSHVFLLCFHHQALANERVELAAQRADLKEQCRLLSSNAQLIEDIRQASALCSVHVPCKEPFGDCQLRLSCSTLVHNKSVDVFGPYLAEVDGNSAPSCTVWVQ